MLILQRSPNETIRIGDHITIVNCGAHGARIGIDAPSDVQVHRGEVYDKIKAEKEAAALADPQNHGE